MAPFNTTNHSSQQHSQQHHHHHPQQPHSAAGTNSNNADVLSSTGLAHGGGSNTQHHPSPHQHHLSTSHHHPQLHPPPLSLHHNPAAAQHFERSSSTTTSATTTTFLVPVTSSGLAPLDTSSFLSAAASPHPHFVTSSPVTFSSPHPQVGGGASAASSSSTSSSYTFVQIKREPCQVSEVTTSNTNHHHHHQQHHTAIGSLTSAGSLTAAAAAAKTMSSSTLTTLVKIEASSPKVHDMDKGHMSSAGSANMVNSSNNTVPIGIAVARKRPQETTAPPPPGPPPSLTSSSTLPLSQQLNKDMNCFGIRVADLGGVGTGCGNFYFTGNGDLMTSSAAADELALNAASLQQSVNRASSTFWQYPNALPIESVISMSPATVGLQYSREASRGQVVLLPATATSLDPFQQAAAAAFVWPSYIPQGTAPATLQPPPNFIFPSMSPHSTLQAAAAAQPYATSLQFLGSNYLTAAAAAAAAAAATSTLCQHNQQTNSTSSSINLSLGGSVVSGAASGTTMSSSSSSTTTRFMSLATAAGPPPPSINDTGQTKGGGGCGGGGGGGHTKALTSASGTHTLALAQGPASLLASSTHHPPQSLPPLPLPHPLLIPPSALKLEDWSGADFMAAAAAAAAAAASKTNTMTTMTSSAAALGIPPPTHYETRDNKHGATTTTMTNPNATNLMELPAPATQALNLMRLPTPPSSATIETATAAAAAASGTPQLPPLLFHAAAAAAAANGSPTPTLLNLSATLNRVTGASSHSTNSAATTTAPNVMCGSSASLATNTNFMNSPAPANAAQSTLCSTTTTTVGPPTPLGDDMALNFKSNLDGTPPQIVVGVPRVVNPALPTIPASNTTTMTQAPPPQMQDVNIQTDTPVCSEDENSSCPLNQNAPCAGGIGAAAASQPLEPCTTAQCTPPLTQNDELYHDTEAQEPLELTKTTTISHRTPCSPQVESSTIRDEAMAEQEQGEEYHLRDSPLKHVVQNFGIADYMVDEKGDDSHQQSVTPAIISSSTTAIAPLGLTNSSTQEDLTGLELLSNISTSTLVKSGAIRVKQEPLDPINDQQNMCHAPAESYAAMESNSYGLVDPTPQTSSCDHQLNSVALNSVDYPIAAPPSPTSLATHHTLEQLQQQQQQQHSSATQLQQPHQQSLSNLNQTEVEPLGGLKLLCALAEQRIHEEEEVQSTSLHNNSNGNGFFRPSSAESPHSFATSSFPQSSFVKPATSSIGSFHGEAQNSTFPSLETLELPSTSGTTTCFSTSSHAGLTEETAIPVKRKKHKHSKSSKSSSSNSNGSSSKKSQKCGKKNKKKYSKEKKRHKLALAEVQQSDLDFEDPQLQQELQNAFQNCADPNYQRMGGGKWPTPQEIFSIMESSMRIRLADITRQYRKKKRKLDEISKNKKKKKCSKLQAAAQQLSLVGGNSGTLSTLVVGGANDRNAAAAAAATNTTTTSSLTSSPLCDYKFGNFSSKSNTTNSSNYLAPSSFIRFATTDSSKSQSHQHHHHLHHHNHHQTHPQFPPPPEVELENDNTTTIAANSSTSAPIYKPLRLEPSSLSAASKDPAAANSSSSSVLRLAQKHASSEKLCHVIVCKERKLGPGSTSSRRSSAEEADEDNETPSNDNQQHHPHQQHHSNGRRSLSTDPESALQPQSSKSTTSSCSAASSASSSRKMNPIDRSLMLTQDHLFRKETRVLTDMGGLFYAGIMKPLQPPDVYAITLDGERGNKSHIMSREEIFKDTILEVAPKTVEDVPVGTRLCAYWSQQYRCLYPGRAIESESSDDGVTSQEFVSVEFDDGDSGRIRLQNIRYLLSDYPIVEYNDNPLYSLGKQKKANANKTPNNNDTDHHQHQHLHHEGEGSDDHGHHNGQDERVTSNGSGSSHRDYHQATAMEIFAAKRSEKKRNKSLKKKSQNACNNNNASSSSISNGTTNVSSSSAGGAASSNNVNGSLDSSECLRKHHKHKKRKKHKKHRKNLMEIGIVSEMDKKQSYSPTSSFSHKSERTKKEVAVAGSIPHQQHQSEPNAAEDEASYDDDEGVPPVEEDHNNTQTEDSQIAEDNGEAEDEEEEEEEEEGDDDADDDNHLNLSHIKRESGNHHHQSTTSQQNVKVKTEHLEMEEESTSNLMSEISDEAKADDMVEHNSSKGSKIAAFLPDRQLWGWLGTAYCKFGTKGTKGRIRKQFYKTIKRGKETITVGDCAVFLSTGRPDRPYIGRIESMWENSCNNKIVRVRWFYHPEETTGCPKLKFPGALFESPHEDENDVQTISHRCEVLQFARYFNKFGADSKQYQSIYDNNDTYYLAGYYNPRLQVLKLQDNIPTLEEQQQQQQQQQQQLQLQLQKHQSQSQQIQNTTTTATVINNNNNSSTNTNPNHTNIND